MQLPFCQMSTASLPCVGRVHDAREELSELKIGLSAKARSLVRAKGRVNFGPVCLCQVLLRRRQDHALFASQVVPQEICIGTHQRLQRDCGRDSGFHVRRTRNFSHGLCQLVDKLEVAHVLRRQVVQHRVQRIGALAQELKQVLVFLGMMQG